jgi:dihydropteroate synthase
MRHVAPAPATADVLELGGVRHDLRRRALVMGILNRTRDSFFDGGRHLRLDDLLRAAERLVGDGADLLDVGARAGGVGTEPLAVAEEAERAAGALAALHARFDVPLSVDSRHAEAAAAAIDAGAVVINDMSGFEDPAMLTLAARRGVAVVATHIRLPPGVPDPDPRYADVVEDVAAALAGLVRRAVAAGVVRERVVVDPGLDLGKTWRQSLCLLDRMDRFAAVGRPVLLAASNKIFLGRALGLRVDERGPATVAACTLGVTRGARVLRVHDARAGRQVADLLAAVAEAAEDP